MKWKNRLTNYNFWISMVSAVLLVLQAFDINFDIAYINEIATAVLGLLVVIGIITDPTRSNTSATTTEVKTQETATPSEAKSEATEQTVEEQIIPIDNQNENNTIDIQNDFKVLMTQMQHDIEEMSINLNNLKNSSSHTLRESTLSNKAVENVIVSPVETQTSYNIVN